MYRKRIVVGVKSSFEALHRWVDAPEEVAFLRFPHRHQFNITAELEVTGMDRSVEFFLVKKEIDLYVEEELVPSVLSSLIPPSILSCESMAHLICDYLMQTYSLPSCKVIVQEDAENYGSVELWKE